MINSSTNNGKNKGVELTVQGIVQGVGFRPFVYHSANQCNLTGSVANTGEGVIIRLFGGAKNISNFQKLLEDSPPPLAQILSIDVRELEPSCNIHSGFSIIQSSQSDNPSAIIPPDIAICNDCYREFCDPDDRRYHYPFINCTNCGPRYTITETIPYDRPKTSMKVFPMCKSCMEEYENPADRRFHAQPNGCYECGPSVSLHQNSGEKIECDDPVHMAVTMLADDKVLGIRGIGGFHLAVNGYSRKAVSLLRDRKGRPDKPLAVMVPNLETAKEFASLSTQEEHLLLSPEHPIVLLKKKATFALAENLAPGVNEVGVMLAYTPLHHLLFTQRHCPTVLVMTSGNLSSTPICTANEEAVARLGHITDGFLLHNREIVTRVDDSVTRLVGKKLQIIRRARGYVPSPVLIPWKMPLILGCGGGLKSTFCLARNNTALLSQHIGDLFNLESYDFYLESIRHMKDVFEIEPEAIACDMHPDYMSTRYAKSLQLPVYEVQHHHAHAVSVMAEHHLDEPVLAVILDGTGYGTDKTIWGGEILVAEPARFSRAGHLSQLPLPGGDKAAQEGWRMALSALHLTVKDEIHDPAFKLPASLGKIDKSSVATILTMIKKGFNCPLTSSAGRLFDAITALLGIRLESSYEGQAAMELEAAARRSCGRQWLDDLASFVRREKYRPERKKEGIYEISTAELIKVIIDHTKRGYSSERIALEFHFMLINSFAQTVKLLAEETGLRKVVLSGGCMQNAILLEGFRHALSLMNLHVYTGENVPINDGGISLGQTIIGGLSHVSCSTNEGH